MSYDFRIQQINQILNDDNKWNKWDQSKTNGTKNG